MAKRVSGVRRTMGERAVRLNFTLSVRGSRRITDRAWDELQAEVDKFVEGLVANTIFATPVVQETTYSRDVEFRDPISYD